MSKKASKKKATKNQHTHFPGDPRYGVQERPLRQDVGALRDGEMLNTRLLDCLIQRASPPPAAMTSKNIVLGGLSTRSYMATCNALFEDDGITTLSRDKMKRIEKIRSRFENVFDLDNDCMNRLIIPIIYDVHFFVLVLDFNQTCPDFIVNVDFYDSLRRSTRAGAHVPIHSSDIVAEVNEFLCHFVLHGPVHRHLQRTHFDLFDKIAYQECPAQSNLIDCGLFCVGVLLHLLDGKAVDKNTFSHKHITELRFKLSDHFVGARHNRANEPNHQPTSQVVRDCFPRLQGTTIMSEYGVEDVTPLNIPAEDMSTTATTITTAQSTTRALAHASIPTKDNHGCESNNNGYDNNCCEVYKSDNTTCIDVDSIHAEECTCYVTKLTPAVASLQATSTMGKSEDSTSSYSNSMCDKVFQDILNERKIDAFGALEDVEPLIEEYERRTGNQLSIRRSERNSFRQYVCKEHINCMFQIFVGRRRGDGMFLVKRVVTNHASDRRQPRAVDGRHWKKRRAHKLDDMIVKVRNTKNERPTPADVIKTAATHSGEIISYSTAYRALHYETSAQSRAQVKNFELVVPYIEQLKKQNTAGSVIGCQRDDSNHVTDIYVFLGFMNISLSFVRPVVSLDAAHLRSVHKGTLYVASVLSGANEVYPIGFMISTGNEDGPTWTRMLGYLREAYPILSEQGFESGSVIDGEMDGEYRHPFVFMSDRDKGLKPALREIFPRNLAVSCAKHIQANVKAQFGQLCARYVIQIAKTFSTRKSDDLLDKIRNIKPAAADYIENVEDIWRSTDWMDSQRTLPPRYGIVTSNTSECVNNMFADARDVGWLEAIACIVDIMSTRISQCRMKHVDREPSEVVTRVGQIVKLRWDASAKISVIEIERGGGDFKTIESLSGRREESVDNEEDEIASMPLVSGGEHSVHIVKPNLQWCSCGIWQDYLYPCRHACAVYRKWYERDFQYVLQNHVHRYYTFDYVQKMYKKNIFPVCVDNINYDRATKPPVVRGRQTGRPPEKRIRHRSECIRAEDSSIKCGRCGQRGHNIRTCKNQEMDRTL